MAVGNFLIKIFDGNHEKPVRTDALEAAFKALGVDGVTLTKDGNGNLVLSAPIIAPAGSGGTALATAQSVTDEVNRATAAEGSLQSDIDAVAQDVADLTTALGDETTRATNAENALDGRLDTAESEINDLQADLAAVLANTPKEQLLDGDGTTVAFTATAPGLTWDASNTVRDIEIEIDGRTQERSVAGDFSDGVWKKNSTTQIEFQTAPGAGTRVRIWRQGTSSGGGGGGAGQTQGNPANAFYLLDQDDMVTVWKLSIVNGVLDLEAV